MPVGDTPVGRIAVADQLDTLTAASLPEQRISLTVEYQRFTEAFEASVNELYHTEYINTHE